MIITLLVCLVIKHFIFDFVYQPAYQWQNKGRYGHWGGLVHSAQHGIASAVILPFFIDDKSVIAYLVAFEFIVHYHMDYFKMKLNAHMGWKCNTHYEFWVWTGFDQLIHSLTYLVMAEVVYRYS
jgi:hypothetical protein